MGVNVTSNTVSAASTLKSRKSAVDQNLSVSITASTTGIFEDTTNTDTVTAGDIWNFQLITGGTGTSLTFKSIYVRFAETTNTYTKFSNYAVTALAVPDNTSPFFGLTDLLSTSSTEANNQFRFRKAGTLEHGYINITQNDVSSASTFTLRKNATNSTITMSITGNTTGIFEDTTHTEAVVAGDDWNWQLVVPSVAGSHTVSVAFTSIGFDSINSDFILGCQNIGLGLAFNNTANYSVCGSIVSSAETNQQIKTNLVLTASELTIDVSANTITTSASTFRLRKNAGNVNSVVSIAAGTTGILSDSTNTDSLITTDKINFQVVTPNTSGTLTLQVLTMSCDATVTTITIDIIESVIRASQDDLTCASKQMLELKSSIIQSQEQERLIPNYNTSLYGLNILSDIQQYWAQFWSSVVDHVKMPKLRQIKRDVELIQSSEFERHIPQYQTWAIGVPILFDIIKMMTTFGYGVVDYIPRFIKIKLGREPIQSQEPERQIPNFNVWSVFTLSDVKQMLVSLYSGIVDYIPSYIRNKKQVEYIQEPFSGASFWQNFVSAFDVTQVWDAIYSPIDNIVNYIRNRKRIELIQEPPETSYTNWASGVPILSDITQMLVALRSWVLDMTAVLRQGKRNIELVQSQEQERRIPNYTTWSVLTLSDVRQMLSALLSNVVDYIPTIIRNKKQVELIQEPQQQTNYWQNFISTFDVTQVWDALYSSVADITAIFRKNRMNVQSVQSQQQERMIPNYVTWGALVLSDIRKMLVALYSNAVDNIPSIIRNNKIVQLIQHPISLYSFFKSLGTFVSPSPNPAQDIISSIKNPDQVRESGQIDADSSNATVGTVAESSQVNDNKDSNKIDSVRDLE